MMGYDDRFSQNRYQKIIKLFYDFDFQSELLENRLFKNIFIILYYKYNRYIANDLCDEKYQILLKIILTKLYFIYSEYSILNSQNHISFLFKNIKNIDFQFKLFLSDENKYDKIFFLLDFRTYP